MRSDAGPRLVLKPLAPCEPERRAAAARAAALAARGRELRTGDLVTAEGVSWVVRRGARGNGEAALEFDFSPDPPKRAVADALFLVDASWSMRRPDLPPSRLDAVKRALAAALANAGDVVHRAAVATFDAEAELVAGFARPDAVDLPALDAVVPRGRGNVLAALDLALDALARDGDPEDEAVVLLATDTEVALARAQEAAARAARLGVQVHVLDTGSRSTASLERLAEATGGTYHDAFAGVTFRPAFQALADRFGVPLAWRDPARHEGDAELEVVLRAMTEREADEFPALPRRLRRK